MKPKLRLTWPLLSIGILSAWLVAVEDGAATGGYNGPGAYLEKGGRQADEAPQFFWNAEVKRLARGFRPADTPVPPAGVFPPQVPEESGPGDEPGDPGNSRGLTRERDRADFAAALKEGRVKPPDAAAAQKQHDEARAALAARTPELPPLPAEFASEFADYHRGAHAFRQGAAHYAEARTAWEALLARPAAERHYRTVWAAFMLGKLALKERRPEAAQWFQKTRALAKEGFADSLAMAADSYGWEARSEWKQGHPEKAAPLYLAQLALGDESAVASLKALIPDRDPIEGGLNYGPEPEEMEAWTPQQTKEAERKKRAGLRVMAADPLLRRLETVHILATETVTEFGDGWFSQTPRGVRITRWFDILKEAGVKRPDDAEYLGFAAYRLGDYAGAARWLEMSKGDSGVAHWLRAKLQRRAGKLEDAAKSMLRAWEALQEQAAYIGAPPVPAGQKPNDPASRETQDWLYAESSFRAFAAGDLAALKLARGEFLQAFETFRKGEHWGDAAYLAESILTIEELKTYVDREAPPPDPGRKLINGATEDAKSDPKLRLRWLLGRRLVRADRYTEALPYLPEPYQEVLRTYAKALKDGASPGLEKAERARAWFAAAWIARHDGMEIMGTEFAPDVFVDEGEFEAYPLAQERRVGKYKERTFTRRPDEETKETMVLKPIALKPTKDELERLNKFRLVPDVRFHYRIIAAALAMNAAALLPDNTPELADVINVAGHWTSDRDNKLADQYYAALMKRASNTDIGRAAKAKRWFVDMAGPWSERARQAREAAQPK